MTGPANMVEGGGAAALDFEASAIVAAHAAAIKMDAARKALLAEKLADELFDPDRYVGWVNLTDYGKAPYRKTALAVIEALLAEVRK